MLFDGFLKEIKEDYENCDSQFCIAFDKFAERYKVAKSKLISWLNTFLYDIKRGLDPLVHIKSGSMIRVQAESIKRRKSGGGGAKWKYSINIGANNENDPQNIPKCKTWKTSKKEHNLGKNVSKNLLN